MLFLRFVDPPVVRSIAFPRIMVVQLSMELIAIGVVLVTLGIRLMTKKASRQ